MALPMPRLAPVMKSVLPLSVDMWNLLNTIDRQASGSMRVHHSIVLEQGSYMLARIRTA
jgi:hypothetical protein